MLAAIEGLCKHIGRLEQQVGLAPALPYVVLMEATLPLLLGSTGLCMPPDHKEIVFLLLSFVAGAPFVSMLFHILFSSSHISGVDNEIVDTLSWFQVHRLHIWVPAGDRQQSESGCLQSCKDFVYRSRHDSSVFLVTSIR